jgi:hypothetical protein
MRPDVQACGKPRSASRIMPEYIQVLVNVQFARIVVDHLFPEGATMKRRMCVPKRSSLYFVPFASVDGNIHIDAADMAASMRYHLVCVTSALACCASFVTLFGVRTSDCLEGIGGLALVPGYLPG